MINKKLKLAISPCPNDTFVFGPWIKQFINIPEHLEIEVDYLDIQELNEQALASSYDLIKLSAAHFPKILNTYALLSCGAALTDRTGPLLIAKEYFSPDHLLEKKIVLPGYDTTAACLFRYLYPEAKNLEYGLFSDIENRIMAGQADAGVIIHESRFSYESKQLIKILDLGEEWFAKTKCPVPLGVIAIQRHLIPSLGSEIEDTIRKSIHWARQNTDELLPFIQSKSSELELDIILQHIDLYVNDYTLNLGASGKIALMKLCNYIHNAKLNPTQVFM